MPDTTQSPTAAQLPLPEGADLDRLIFSRIIGIAAAGNRSLTVETGLTPEQLVCVIERYASQYLGLLAGLNQPGDAGTDAPAIEEDDLNAFILEHRGHDGEEAAWLAAILARRSLESNHLWQDMGFAHRGELNAMFERHFPALRALNAQDMKWKKFFYRQLCEREGFSLCKSPNCEVCEDFTDCFGAEPGDPLSTLAHLSRASSGT